MTRKLIEMHAGVALERVVIVFPGAVNWLRFTPQQAKDLARKLWKLAEEAETAKALAAGESVEHRATA